MLQRYRLADPETVRRARAVRKAYGARMAMEVAPSRGRFPRFTIVVSTKIGNAVLRHRIQRRLREAMRLHLRRMGAVDIVVRVRSAELATAAWGGVCSELEALLRKTQVLGR